MYFIVSLDGILFVLATMNPVSLQPAHKEHLPFMGINVSFAITNKISLDVFFPDTLYGQ